MRRREFIMLSGGVLVWPLPTLAQSFPTRPVRIIVPFAPAGPTDVFARLLIPKLSETLGQQFYVENQAGAGGNIGMGNAARATPDGYTIVFVSTSYIVNPSLYAKIPYDPLRTSHR
jgi:tripartite-type tricarboxylate transporter receptor subunit TctC